MDDEQADPDRVRRIMCCTGKVFYDLDEVRRERELDDVAIIRIEQLYPFPDTAMEQIAARYAEATELYWVQEEPHNMGAWSYIRPRLEQVAGDRFAPKLVSREESASPATGSSESHKVEQEMIINEAFDGLGASA